MTVYTCMFMHLIHYTQQKPYAFSIFFIYYVCLQVIVVTQAQVPHGIYWLSSDLGPRAAGLEGKSTTEPIIISHVRTSELCNN